MIKLLERLNSGEALQVKTLIEEHTGVTQGGCGSFILRPKGYARSFRSSTA